MPPILLDCFALAVAFRGLSCLYCFAPVVCGFLLGCGLWLSFPLVGMTKRKGAPLLVLPLFVRGLWACISLVPSARLRVFGYSRLGMPLHPPLVLLVALYRSYYKKLRHPSRNPNYFAGLYSMCICLLLFSYLFLLVGYCFPLFPFGCLVL